MVEITEKLIKDLYSRFVPCGDAEDVICHLKDLFKETSLKRNRYYLNNKDKIQKQRKNNPKTKIWQQNWRDKNPEKIKELREISRLKKIEDTLK
jgi:hypothetical protein